MNKPPTFLFTPALVAVLTFAATAARAEVTMPAIFGDHMVLQQDGKVPIWGWATAGEAVSVSLGNATTKTVAGVDGKWRVDLAAVPASAAPQTLTVTGKNRLKFEDVLVGEVWVCSGQSNMEFELRRTHLGGEDTPKANDPQIRLFRIPRTNRAEPQTDVTAKWEICTPQTAGAFSGAAYYFARELREHLRRPIGLIGTYWGGTPAQAWTSLSALQQPPAFTGYVQQTENNLKNYTARKGDYPRLQAEYLEQKKKWDAETKPGWVEAMKTWTAEAAAAKAAGKAEPPKPQPSPPEPPAPRDPNPGPQQATALFNGMIAPLIPYAMRGVIWYQGESNTSQAEEYRTLFPRMIADWRARWERGDFPFLFVQLASYASSRGTENYPLLREAQLKTLALPNTGMAVAIDIGAGKDIHPADKKDIGLRLALAARRVAYQQDVVFSGPIYESMRVEGRQVRLTFQQSGSGLKIGTSPWTPAGVPDAAASGSELTGFVITGADRRWVTAKARIEGASVLVSSEEVPVPIAVRYGWEGDPKCNLYNRENLPASPFRTDDWPQSTEPEKNAVPQSQARHPL